MSKSFFLKSSAVLMSVILLFASCASSTMINSIPSGAKVYINGEPVGTTPYLYTDTKIVGSIVNVDLKKDGYEPFYTTFSRTEQVDVGAIVGGVFLLFPFLWTMQYKSTHTYELIPLSTSQNYLPDAIKQ
ncbi:MAG: PEGA domain-containing protein [Paludibacter sp.]|nr:PEGA domain-containing protein [Paludibacter sp.]